ncbi:MAG TPA: hypothetical protein VGQ36_13085 [Thermoanaerobaculia bacterium]|jgi:hypothetical protein|nr:hypothetical protein [Thermoanaerobaculia bacterium]
MRIVPWSLLLFALFTVVACTTSPYVTKGTCDNVRCASCPDGQTPTLKPPDCCKCAPVDTTTTDCSNVRCAACPPGQTPSLEPPNYCNCVAIK